MVVVTNRIRVKKGMGQAMAGRFTAPGPLDSFQGFVKVEVLLRQNLDDHDEVNVNMYWESLADFTVWRESDAFREAHKRPEPGAEPKESPILGSELVTYDVAAVKEARK
ncbi:heme oxygenase [Brevibacillus sp. TJ4]|uniref:heme oxygenase n=1 Tax=Brevibacillus sp. TJ4 TaxID=3234853 RepID=UPI0037D89CAD